LVSPTLDRDAYWGEHTLVDAAGSIFFRGARRIRKRSPDGQVEILADGLADITALAWGPDESIYVVDGDALRRIGLNDQITTLASNLLVVPADDPIFVDGLFNSIWDISVDGEGTVYLAYNGNRRVLTVGTDGQVCELYHAPAPWSPMGVAVAGDGTLYILEVWFREGVGWKGPRVRHLSADGAATTLVEVEGTRTRVIETEREAAADVALICAPNPFNGQTLISYSLPEPAHVHLRVFNIAGGRVKDLVDAVQTAGSHGITWDATDDEGRAVSSGVYLCELRFGGETQTVSLTLLR
jgi:hypothetical protein